VIDMITILISKAVYLMNKGYIDSKVIRTDLYNGVIYLVEVNEEAIEYLKEERLYYRIERIWLIWITIH